MYSPTHHIFEFTPETLGAWCAQRQLAPFRAAQILEWVYQKGIVDPRQMTNLSKWERDLLEKEITFLTGDIVNHQSATDGVQKLLIQWHDPTGAGVAATDDVSVPLAQFGAPQVLADTSRQTECVMIPVEYDGTNSPRRTACISSQVGCPVGCKFCASGLGGLEGNLSAGRIIEQVWRLGRLPRVNRITNIVFMGMGEPLSNLNNVVRATRTICALWGLGISARKVTISTVGLPKAIEKLAEELDLPVTLALSLHAPTDEIRRTLIPWAHYTTIDELLDACHAWFRKTGREITLEYTLLRGVNDLPEHARRLGELARTLRANINLIRYNEVAGIPFNRPRSDDVVQFQRILVDAGINTHIRASRGRDIAAACGQLRHESHKKAGARD
ncbi:23S rRNA (adenine(2503)-C(2))-methyltransferase RlmN [soil metagenome]